MTDQKFRLITRVLISLFTMGLTWNVWAGFLTFALLTYLEHCVIEFLSDTLKGIYQAAARSAERSDK